MLHVLMALGILWACILQACGVVRRGITWQLVTGHSWVVAGLSCLSEGVRSSEDGTLVKK